MFAGHIVRKKLGLCVNKYQILTVDVRIVSVVMDAPAWQLEFVFYEMSVRKYGIFGRFYNHRFQHHLYRSHSSMASRTLVYSLPLTREGLETWGMSGWAVMELGVLGMLMRPELRRFDLQYRDLVRHVRSRSQLAFQVVLDVLAQHGVDRDDIKLDWKSRSHPTIPNARQVSCQISALCPLSPEVREIALDAATAAVKDRCELSWGPLSVFDIGTLRVERLAHRSSSESDGYLLRSV
jgi:hypothetical protein